jgi:hypothetical protein
MGKSRLGRQVKFGLREEGRPWLGSDASTSRFMSLAAVGDQVQDFIGVVK